MKEVQIREMLLADYEAAVQLWKGTPGLGLSDADSQEHIRGFLERNKEMSFIAECDGELVGTALSGHDGRRGFIYHLTVRQDHRHRHIGRELVYRCLTALRRDGIAKCHVFVFADNAQGMRFWEQSGFAQREELVIYSQNIDRKLSRD